MVRSRQEEALELSPPYTGVSIQYNYHHMEQMMVVQLSKLAAHI
jgi:hypothetical protein